MTDTAEPVRTLKPFEALHEAMWLQLNDKLASAEDILRQITRGMPGAVARRQLILLLRHQHRWDEALEVVRQHAAVDPASPDHAYYLATSLLELGRYAEAWPLYERRRQTPAFAGHVLPPCPEWLGQPVNSLLVLDEQGFGDTIQFARFVPELVERGLEVTVACRPQLVELFRSLGAHVVARSPRMDRPECDAWTFIGSLPLRLGVTLQSLRPDPYLKVSEERRATWAERVPAAARIGVVTKGRPTHPADATRSLPIVAATFAQSFPGAVVLEKESSPLGFQDFADLAAIMERLDLVLTVDTAAAHLAGALGIPCWVMLPWDPDWRWLHDREDSPWYASLRLYRQSAPGDWRGVLARVRRDLKTS